MSIFTKAQNPDAAVFKLLKSLSIGLDPKLISEELDKHPDYPSLLALSDVLWSFNIENAAYRVEPDNLANVTCPFIAHTKLNGGDFLVVTKITGDTVLVSSEKWNQHKMPLAEFKKAFDGIVLTAEPAAQFKAATSFSNVLVSLREPALIAGGVLLFALALIFHTGYLTGLSWQSALLAVFKSAGLVTSILLLVQSIDSNNPLVQKLCQGGSKTDCNAILSSKAAKVFDWLSWSEVGFFYFAGTWLLLLFGGSSPLVLLALALLNLVSLPYTIYSIYYQANIAKKWCVLCCTVQALLWLEFVPLLLNHSLSFAAASAAGFSFNAISSIIICLLLPVVLWMLVKPLLIKLQQLPTLKQQLRKFKYNTDLFNNVLTAQPKYAQPDESWSIVLGNVEANSIITMVSNPYCQPCATMHKYLDELLEQNGNVQARLVFTASNTDEDIRTPVSRHLMALNELPDKTIVKRALHDWYEQKQKDYTEWAKVYPVQLNEANYYKLERQNEWCKMAEVTFTPTMLLNGYRLPDLYRIPDLKYMLD
jgi:uncharacterized membrane protein